MADSIITRTKKLTRDKLRQFLPNHQAIKTFEDLTHDVVTTLPDAIQAQTDDSSTLALLGVGLPKSQVASAQALADQVNTLLQTNRTQQSTITALRRDIDDLQAQLQACERLQSSAITTLRRDLDDTRTLIQGI